MNRGTKSVKAQQRSTPCASCERRPSSRPPGGSCGCHRRDGSSSSVACREQSAWSAEKRDRLPGRPNEKGDPGFSVFAVGLGSPPKGEGVAATHPPCVLCLRARRAGPLPPVCLAFSFFGPYLRTRRRKVQGRENRRSLAPWRSRGFPFSALRLPGAPCHPPQKSAAASIFARGFPPGGGQIAAFSRP